MSETPVNYGSVSPPYWEDDLFLIGGGKSAVGFDYSLLREKRVLAVNSHSLSLVNAAAAVAVFSLDNRWVRGNRDFLAGFAGEKYVALPLETWPDCGGIPGVTYLRWGYEFGLSEDPSVVNTGGNSGYAALNLAYLKRARRIFLVGFDMNWHEDPTYFQWAAKFRTTVRQLVERGMPVYNVNPRSSIDAFPRIDSEGVRSILRIPNPCFSRLSA